MQTPSARPDGPSFTATEPSADFQMWKDVQFEAYDYFRTQTNSKNGLVADSTEPRSPCSIAAVGLGLTSRCVAVGRGWMSREQAAQESLVTLRWFLASEQSAHPMATGYHGFYYHFLDMETGARARGSELSTMDTAILMAGILTVGSYFDLVTSDEIEIRALADALYRRVDWNWACNQGPSVSHGWDPAHGFLPFNWAEGYSEALLLYILALGSPTA